MTEIALQTINKHVGKMFASMWFVGGCVDTSKLSYDGSHGFVYPTHVEDLRGFKPDNLHLIYILLIVSI
jgi:hypothetical protein